jgi:ribosomal protein S18 acetylase RimI-like enzyme
MPELVLCTPSTDNLEGLLALMNDPRSVHRQTACRHGETPEPAGQLYDRLAEDENLIALLGSELVGYASWQTYGRHAHLNVLSISGAHQRKGIGNALFQAFLKEAKEQGAKSYSLRAYRDSGWAIGFYERQGLQPTTAVASLSREDAGFRQYIELSISNGQWPSAEKVLFYGRLA